MPTKKTPPVTLPQKSYKKLLIGLAVLIVLMFIMIAAIVIQLTGKGP